MDLKSVAGLHRLTEYLAHPDSRYPLQIHGVLAGLVIGLGVSVVLLSPLAGFAVFVLFASAGLLWRKDEPPVLVYCIAERVAKDANPAVGIIKLEEWAAYGVARACEKVRWRICGVGSRGGEDSGRNNEAN